jgi:hypothetical protein
MQKKIDVLLETMFYIRFEEMDMNCKVMNNRGKKEIIVCWCQHGLECPRFLQTSHHTQYSVQGTNGRPDIYFPAITS